MPSILKIEPEDVDSAEKRSNFTVCILGCGQKGVLYATAFAELGYKVLCTDANASVIKKVAKGKLTFSEPELEAKLKTQIIKGQISVTGDIKKTVSQSDIVIIAFTTKITEQKKADTTQTISACKQIGVALNQDALVFYGGIAGFGLNENTIKETLENTSGYKAGRDFGLVYNPILTAKIPLANQDLKVAANDANSLNAAMVILRTISKNVTPINNLKTAEIATLFTLARQDINGALANEFVIFCEKAKIDYYEIIKLQNIRDQSFCPSMGDTESRNETYFLLESAENFNAKLRLPDLAKQINDNMIKYTVNLTQNILRACGKTMRRARVTVLGSTNPEAAPSVFAKKIEQKGAKVSLYDPYTKKDAVNPGLLKSSLNEAVEGADCLVILSQAPFTQLTLKKIKPLMKTPSVIVDLIGKFEPAQVEAEGFLYRGLGRGYEE